MQFHAGVILHEPDQELADYKEANGAPENLSGSSTNSKGTASMTVNESLKRPILFLCAAFIFLLIALLTKTDVTMSGNESSRFGTIQAVAEQNTFAIENTCFRTVDYIVINDKVYSDKPLPQMLALGILYKGIAAVTGISFETKYFLSVYLVNLLGIGLLNIVLFLLFFSRIDRDSEAPFLSKLLLSASLPLSTLLLSYGVSMNNHTPAALMLFILMTQLLDYPKHNSAGFAFLAGLSAGFLLDLEIPIGGLFGIGSFLVVLLTSEGRRFAKTCLYSLGGVIPILLLLLINHMAIGRALPQYIGSGSGGTFKFTMPDANTVSYLFNVLIGNRGFFSYMPAMLFIIPSILLMRKRGVALAEWIVLGTAVSVMLFYALGTSEYGGWAYAFRYLVPLIPLVWYFIVREYAGRTKTWQYGLLSMLVLFGVATSYVGAFNPWCSCNEGFRSPPDTTDYHVRNTFAANLLCMSFESGFDSPLFNFLVDKVYGPEIAVRYLNEAYTNTKNLEQLGRVREYCQGNPEMRGLLKHPSSP